MAICTAVCRTFATPEARSDTTPAFLWLVCVVNMAVSCEESYTNAYSADLMWRMVYQVKALGKSYQEVAECLNVDKSTVSRIIALYESSSDVAYPPNSGTSILTEVDQYAYSYIIRVLQEGNCLWQLSRGVIHCEHGSVQRASRIVGIPWWNWSWQKGQHALIWLYLKRQTCSVTKTTVVWWRVSAIAAISCGGVLDCYTTHGTVNGDTFCHFLEYDLCPKLQPFNGVNPNSVVVLDNASIHHV